MNLSEKGVELIKGFEGFVAKPYLCPAKVWTIGYGTTRYPNGEKVKPTDISIDKEKATEYLKHDVKTFENGVDSYLRDDITQNQFDSVVSFAYNLGLNALKNSTLLKVINHNPNDLRIKKEFLKWVNAGGKVSGGLITRRQKEVNLYFEHLN